MDFGDHNLGLWNTFEICDSDDITNVLNKREECGNLYEVQTIGRICPQEPAMKNPNVSVVQAENQGLSVVADTFIFLFGDSEINLKATINIGCQVDSICFRPDGQMIIAADSSGKIHVASMKTGKVFFTHKVVNIEEDFATDNKQDGLFCNITCLASEEEDDSFCIAVGLRSAKFFVFNNVKLKMLEKAHDERNIELGKAAQRAMSLNEYDSSHIQMTTMTNLIAAYNGYCNIFITMGNGKSILALWYEDMDPINPNNDSTTLKLSSSVRSDLLWADNNITIVKGVYMLHQLYTLDSTGCFYEWFVESMELRRYWQDMRMIDFTVTDSGFGSSASGGKLYAFLRDDDLNTHLSVFKLPKMEKCFTYNVLGHSICKMISGPPFIEDVAFIDGESGSSDIASYLNVRALREASPEDRLFRLLNKHRFEEAEKFALLYNLDLQQVYQPRAVHLMNFIISNISEERSSLQQTFSELKNCLMNMKDGMAAARLCLEAGIPDLRLSYDLLTLGRSRLNDGKSNDLANGEDDLEKTEVRLQIIHQLDRLVTFRLAYGCGSTGGGSADWSHFCRVDLPSELIRLVAAGNISAASILLRRHKTNLLAFLKHPGAEESAVEKHLHTFLEHIPESVDVGSIVALLEDVLIPILLTGIPGSLKILASWLNGRAQSYEQSKPSEWPENGLKMAKVLFNVQNKLSRLGFIRDQMSAGSGFKSTSTEVSNLRLLASRLELLLRLKQRYKCNVTLSEFIQETTMSLAYRMLDRVMVPELVLSSLEVTVRPYMREHKLEEEEVLHGYVEDLLSRFRDQAWGSVESLRERKVVAIIQCMKDPQIILEAIVKLAKRASVPWSEDIHILVKKGMKIAQSETTFETSDEDMHDDEEEEEIAKKRKLLLKQLEYCIHIERLPTVLAEYGMNTNVEMRNSSSHIQIIRFLIHRDTPESIAQAYHFCRTFTTISDIDMYRFRLLQLLRKDRVEDCVGLLIEAEKQKPELKHELVLRMVGFAEGMLESTDKIFAEKRKTYCSTAIQMIEHILNSYNGQGTNHNPDTGKTEDEYFQEKMKEKLCLLKNILDLQVKYNELVSVEQYLNKEFTSRLLSRHISSSISETSSSLSDSSTENITSVSMLYGNTSTKFPQIENQNADSKEDDKQSKVPQNSTNLSHVLNVARILDVPSEKLRGKLALHAARKGQSGATTAITVCRDLFHVSPTEDTADAAFSVTLELLKLSSFTSSTYYVKLIPELINIIAAALMYLKPGQIQEGIELFKFLILCNEVCKVTDVIGDSVVHQPLARKNPFETVTTLYPWMEETGGLMLSSDKVVSIFHKASELLVNEGDFLACRQVRELKSMEKTMTKLSAVVAEMTTTLRMAGQPRLALQWIVSRISTSLRYVANQCDSWEPEASKVLIRKMLHIVEDRENELGTCVDEYVQKVLSSRDVDVNLLVGLLTLVPIAQGHTLLKSELSKAGSNYRRITIPFEKVLFSTPASKSNLLPVIIQHPKASGKLIKDFCNDYGLDYVQALLQFTRVLLSDPHFSIDLPNMAITDVSRLKHEESMVITPVHTFDPKNLLMLAPVNKGPGYNNPAKWKQEGSEEEQWNRPWSEVKQEMTFIMGNIDEKHEMCRVLMKILKSETSPYFYKRCKYILHLITECQVEQREVNVKKGIELLECMKRVKRTKPVAEYERNQWGLTTESHTALKLPVLSKYRLPLHPLLFGDSGSAWKILTPELNEHSATRLVPIARILSLNINKLYMTAVDNSIRAHLDSNKAHHLVMKPHQMAFLRSLTKEMDDYRMATAMAKKIAELLPISEEKVEAYEWCKSISQSWLESLSEDDLNRSAVAKMHQNISSFHCNAAVEYILHKYDLTGPDTSPLIFYPEKLIFVLYQHKSIMQRYFKPVDEAYPDIHKAANEIAEIHSLNILKLRLSISRNWLFSVKDIDKDDEDSTINLTNMKTANLCSVSPSSGSMDDSIVHLLYILSESLAATTARFLLGFAFDPKNPQIMNVHRVRALTCALRLFDDDFLEELTKEKIETIRKKLRIMVYLSELDSISFPIHGSQLEQGNKDEVARSILASPQLRHQPRALRVVAELCLEYDLFVPSTWQFILQQMVALQQMGYLHQLLPDICCHPNISSLSCLATVWQSCVTFPLTAMTPPLNPEEVKVALALYNFLLSCPVLLQIDLKGVAQHFSSVEFPLLALGCLLSDPNLEEAACILAKKKCIVIQDQLQEMTSVNHPILGQAQIIEVLKCQET